MDNMTSQTKKCNYELKRLQLSGEGMECCKCHSTSFASFSRRRGLFKPSSGISSKATVMEESCWLINKINIITPTHRAKQP